MVTKNINTVDTKINAIDKRLTTVETKLNSIDKRLVVVETKLDTLEKSVELCHKRISAVDKKLDSFMLETNTRLTKLETMVTAIHKKVMNGYFDKSKISNIQKKILIGIVIPLGGFIVVGIAPHVFAFLGKVLM